MADGVFNIAKGAAVEMFNDSGSKGILILLKANETEADLIDHDEIAALLAAGNTEADATNYARKTSLTGTVSIDDTNNRVDIDIPDQTFSSLGGASNNTLTKVIFAYENAAADNTRIPLTHHDFALTTDGSDVTVELNSAGFFRST